VPDVFAYANRAEHGPSDAVERRSLVVYLNRYPRAHVRIPGAAEALGLSGGADDYLILRDQRSGLDYLRGVRDLREHGLELSLDGYGCHVFLGFEEVSDAGAAGWGELAMRIGLGGVPDAHHALRRLREEPLRAAVAAVFATRLAREAFLPLPDTLPATGVAPAVAADLIDLQAALEQVAAAAGADGSAAIVATRSAGLARRVRGLRPRVVAQAVAGAILASAIGEVASGEDRERATSGFDDWEMAAAIDEGARASGSSDAQAWRCVELARALVALPPGALATAAATPGLPEAWFALPAVRAASGWNEWQGTRYLSQEAWSELLEALGARDGSLAEDGAADQRDAAAAVAELRRRAAAAGYRLGGTSEGTAAPTPA
jgi:hypothetical protein